MPSPWSKLGCAESLYRELRAMHPEYSRTPIKRYREHKVHALERGISFELTLEQWWQVWNDSGHYAERGPRLTQYNMCRKYDQGGYAVGNVEIMLSTGNQDTRRWARKARKVRIGCRAAWPGLPKPPASYAVKGTAQLIREHS